MQQLNTISTLIAPHEKTNKTFGAIIKKVQTIYSKYTNMYFRNEKMKIKKKRFF